MAASGKDAWPREKRWKDMVTRGEKLSRARQLGFEYPLARDAEAIGRETEVADRSPVRVLFVCSRNQWRSPTAEAVWRRHPRVEARSAGTSPNARHPVSIEDVRWAEVIVVMEEKHRARLLAAFRHALDGKPLHVLDIRDDYRAMDPELVEELRVAVGALLGLEPPPG